MVVVLALQKILLVKTSPQLKKRKLSEKLSLTASKCPAPGVRILSAAR